MKPALLFSTSKEARLLVHRRTSSLFIGLVIILLLSSTGCIKLIGETVSDIPKAFAILTTNVTVLKEEPFAFPENFPLPPHSTVNDVRVDSLSFNSRATLREIYSFYQKELSQFGLTSLPAYEAMDDKKHFLFHLKFAGWPGEKTIFIMGEDLGASTSNDIRLIRVNMYEREGK